MVPTPRPAAPPPEIAEVRSKRTTARPRPRPRAALTFRRWLAGLRPGRLLSRLGKKTRFRVYLALGVLAVLSPIWLLNLAVAFFGSSVVFPLSPYFLRQKLSALGSYALHRPFCAVFGHPDLAPLASAAEVRYRLPRGLLAAVIQVESGGRPHRISSAGAMGPAQLMPDTARILHVGDPFDSAANVDGAARLLAAHLAQFHSVRLAVAAYHAGPAAVVTGVPQNGITPEYVARVMRAYALTRPRRAARV
jgi:soluble lytic murein transglycosylase-like protein